MKNIKLLILDVDGTMTDGGIYVTEEGSQFKKFNAKDGLGIKMAIASEIQVGIISHSSASKMIEKRVEMLGIQHCYVGQENKLLILSKWLEQLNLSLLEVAFVGDDLNDLEIMKKVGLSACPADAVEEIQSTAQVVLKKKGGKGCIREFIEEYLLK